MMIGKDVSRPYKLTISFILAAVLTVAVKMNWGYLNFLDSGVVGFVQGFQSPFLTVLANFISLLASPTMDLIWVLLIAFLLWGFKYKIPAFFALVLIIGGNAIGVIVKHLVARPRPAEHLSNVSGFSYPSGHVLGFFLVAAILWILVTPLISNEIIKILARVVLVIALVMVMMARIYLNAHFPSDTVGAVLIGYTWLQIAEYGYVYFAPKLRRVRLFKNTVY